jgi:hypothetical protein
VSQREGSLVGLAAVIARRVISVRQLYAERSDNASPATEVARQFDLLCRGARLHHGPCSPSTAELELLASDLVPKAIEEQLTRYPTSTVQHQPHRTSEKHFHQSQAA